MVSSVLSCMPAQPEMEMGKVYDVLVVGDTHWFTILHTALELRKFIEKTWPWLISANCVCSLTLVETLGWQ